MSREEKFNSTPLPLHIKGNEELDNDSDSKEKVKVGVAIIVGIVVVVSVVVVVCRHLLTRSRRFSSNARP